MGFLRAVWRGTLLGRTVDTVRNIVDEGSVADGIKRTIKEDLTEDNPITSAIYRDGRYEGKIEGYAEASEEYEAKLLDQADKFLTQQKVFESERDEYEKLLDAYEQEIDALMEKVNRTEAENAYLQQLLMRDRKLRKMAG
ncbi:MAG: hypothetical protein IKY18_00330 [Oscillospiraceae bacterium]|nr:hypothetical protein [Oscillospiraceae bacterium]